MVELTNRALTVGSKRAAHVRRMSFDHIEVGDTVTRLLGGVLPMRMRVTHVDDEIIHCGLWWTFDRVTGAEIDHDLGWGPTYGVTGSFLVSAD